MHTVLLMRSIKHTTGSGHQSSRNDAKDVHGPFHEKTDLIIEETQKLFSILIMPFRNYGVINVKHCYLILLNLFSRARNYNASLKLRKT